ncbi:MAG: HDOD domain-containing protein [Candidatus Eremiobacterota bacterium]
MENRSILERVKDSLEEVASMPHVAAKALELLNEAEPSAAVLSKVFELDMVLTGKLLKIVNSAYYGFTKQVTTVPQAITILGHDNLKSILISTIAFELFSKGKGGLIPPQGLWLHSLGTASFSQALAREMNLPKPEEYYIVGLLHDIGKLILDQNLSEEFRKVMTIVKARRLAIYEVEEQILGMNHSDIGHMVAVYWKIPERVAMAIKFHHILSLCPDKDILQMAAIVQMADFFCNLQHMGDSGNIKVSLVQKESKDIVNLAPDIKQKIIQEVKQDIEKAKSFFEIK